MAVTCMHGHVAISNIGTFLIYRAEDDMNTYEHTYIHIHPYIHTECDLDPVSIDPSHLCEGMSERVRE